MDRPNEIQIHDKTFVRMIDTENIQARITELASQLDAKVEENALFIGILNGSFRYMADLSSAMDRLVDVDFIKLASYSGTASSGSITDLIGLKAPVHNRQVWIIEDIIDSGHTVDKLRSILSDNGATDVHISTLFFKPAAFECEYEIEQVGFEIPNDFIVGYGMDYDALGRNLDSIYVLK